MTSQKQFEALDERVQRVQDTLRESGEEEAADLIDELMGLLWEDVERTEAKRRPTSAEYSAASLKVLQSIYPGLPAPPPGGGNRWGNRRRGPATPAPPLSPESTPEQPLPPKA